MDIIHLCGCSPPASAHCVSLHLHQTIFVVPILRYPAWLPSCLPACASLCGCQVVGLHLGDEGTVQRARRLGVSGSARQRGENLSCCGTMARTEETFIKRGNLLRRRRGGGMGREVQSQRGGAIVGQHREAAAAAQIYEHTASCVALSVSLPASTFRVLFQKLLVMQ